MDRHLSSEDQVMRLLSNASTAGYIGEPVSQLEHALQAAALAAGAGGSETEVLAALLHDLGHLCDPDAGQMADLGVMHHERVGARFLREQGITGEIADLVSLHVDAKRYLAAQAGYAQKLSEASRRTLEYQGDAMTAEQCREFEAHPLFKAALRLRSRDDTAKVPGKEVPDLDCYRPMLRRHLGSALDAGTRSGWQANGFVHLPGWFSHDEMQRVIEATEVLETLPETPGQWMKYFESSDGQRQLCRVENFLQYDAVFDEIARGAAIMQLLARLIGEPAEIFKEKINFKLPGGQGFAAHQDAPAFTGYAQDYHLTVMLSIDPTTLENGCLEIAANPGVGQLLALKEDLTLSDEVVATLDWQPVVTSPGDLVIFDSFLPHRSGVNRSGAARRALYTTYNRAAAGSFRDTYFQRKREAFPPEVERIPGQSYESGVYNVGNPIEQ